MSLHRRIRCPRVTIKALLRALRWHRTIDIQAGDAIVTAETPSPATPKPGSTPSTMPDNGTG